MDSIDSNNEVSEEVAENANTKDEIDEVSSNIKIKKMQRELEGNDDRILKVFSALISGNVGEEIYEEMSEKAIEEAIEQKRILWKKAGKNMKR